MTNLQGGEPILAFSTGDDPAPQEMGHELQAVADPQDGDPQIKDLGRGKRGSLIVDALRAAGENQGAGFFFFDPGYGELVGKYLGIHAQFSDLPGDQLGELRAEIEYVGLIHAQILSEGNESINL